MTALLLIDGRAEQAPSEICADGLRRSPRSEGFDASLRTRDGGHLETRDLRTAALHCRFPVATDSDPSVELRGTAEVVEALGDRVCHCFTAHTVVEGPRSEGRANQGRDWADLLAQRGHSVLTRRVRDLDQLADMYAQAKLGPVLGTDGLDLSALVVRRSELIAEELRYEARKEGRAARSEIGFSGMGARGAGSISFRVALHLSEETAADEIEVLNPDATTILVAVGRVVPGDDLEERVHQLVRLVRHVAVHAWLLRAAEVSVAFQRNLVDRVLKSSPGSIALQKDLVTLHRERSEFIGLDSAWHLGERLGRGLSPLAEAFDHQLDLTRRWKALARRFDQMGSVAESYASLEPVIEPLEFGQTSKTYERFLSEKNPFKQIKLWLADREDRSSRRDDEPELAIEIHPYENRGAVLAELQAQIGVTAFLTTGAGIFLSVLLSNQLNQPDALPFDIFFLFVATFAFFFATLLYSKATQRLSRRGTPGVESEIETANTVAEYLGQYSFLLALPLAVARFLGQEGILIPATVAVLAWLVLLGYHLSPTPLLKQDIRDEGIGSDKWQRGVIVVLLGSAAFAYLGTLFPGRLQPLLIVGSVAYFLTLILLTCASLLVPERSSQTRFLVHPWDGLGTERRSRYDEGWKAARRLQQSRLAGGRGQEQPTAKQ